jgi:hypothetical protein
METVMVSGTPLPATLLEHTEVIWTLAVVKPGDTGIVEFPVGSPNTTMFFTASRYALE